VSTLAALAVEIFLLYTIMSKFGGVRGWTFWEIMFMRCLWRTGYAVLRIFANGLHYLESYIRYGGMDRLLLRPLNPLLSIWFNSFDLFNLTELVPQTLLLMVVNAHLSIMWTPFGILFFVLSIFACAAIELAVGFGMACVSFWVIGGDALSWIPFYFQQLLEYPLSIYGKGVQILLTFVLPYSFMAFYPIHYFLRRESDIVFHPVFCVLGPCVAIVLWTIAYRIWLLGIGRYTSVGS
jgi:ABC-2 type transport system permease protein